MYYLGIDFIKEVNRLGYSFSLNLHRKSIELGPIRFPIIYIPDKPNVFMVGHKNFSRFSNKAKLPKIKIRINEMEFEALLDSGSSITYCRESCARILGEKIEKVNFNGQTANGSFFKFFGMLHPIFEIGNLKFKSKLYVSSDMNCPTDLIIGTDLMAELNKMGVEIRLDILNERIGLGNNYITINNVLEISNGYFENEGKNKKAFVIASQDEVIDPRSDCVLKANIKWPDNASYKKFNHFG